MIARAIVEVQDEWPGFPGTFNAKIQCSECNFTQWSSVRTSKVTAEEYATNSIRHHLETHEPGRAPDIEVEYEIVAYCSVCEDGLGDVEVVDIETLECAECNTVWYIDGTGGEREDSE